MADEEINLDILIVDSEVTIAIRDMLSELYPVQEKSPRLYIHSRRKPRRNVNLNKYRAISTSLSARGFDTTELDNKIAFEQIKTDTQYPPKL